MSSMKIPLKLTDRMRSRPGSARHCVIATAAERSWGGHWTVTPKSVEHTSGNARVMRWRPSAGALLVMLLFDLGLPVPARSVRLIRGKAVPPGRVRRVRQAAAGATVAGVLLLVVSGLAWVVFTVAGVMLAVLGVMLAVRLRADRERALTGVAGTAKTGEHARFYTPPRLRFRKGGERYRGFFGLGREYIRIHPQDTSLKELREANARDVQARREAGPVPAITMPARPGPELEPVQPPAPKATPVISEPPGREVEPASQEVVNERT